MYIFYIYTKKNQIERSNHTLVGVFFNGVIVICRHEFIKVNEVIVCKRCGLTRTEDGKIMFDKKIVNYKSKRRKS